MRWFQSRLIKKTFISYVALLILCVTVFAFFTFRDIKEKTKLELEADSQRAARSLALSIDQNFSRIRTTAIKLARFSWVWESSVMPEDFTERYDPVTRRDILNHLALIVENDNLLQNLTLFFPQKDLAISARGWFSIDRYLTAVRSDFPQLREAIGRRCDYEVVYLDREAMDKSPLIWMVETLDYAAEPRIQLAFSFDKNMLANWASSISFNRLSSMTLYSAENVPLVRIAGPQSSDGPEGVRTVTVPSENFGWYYEISYDTTLLEVPVERFFQWVWIFAIALLVGPLAAWVMTWLSYRPLKALMEKIGQSGSVSGDGEYRMLENAFMRLTEDNFNMKERVEEYQEFAQHDLLMRLLKGCFDQSGMSQELAYYGIDYTEDDSFCVLIVSVADLGVADTSKSGMDSRMMATLLLRQTLEEGPYQSRMLQVLDEDTVVILSGRKEPLEDAALDQYLETLKNTTEQAAEIWRGPIEQRIIGISKSYHSAREKRLTEEEPAIYSAASRESAVSGFYYPTDWEVQLINGVKAGNSELIEKILSELRQENELRNLDRNAQTALFTSLEDTVLRLVAELSGGKPSPSSALHHPKWNGEAECCWEWVSENLESLCQRTRTRKEGDQSIGGQILSYVQENFESPSLSLKEIAQELGIALSTASKAFKNVAQMNFYDYTCRLRMEKVKRLMAEGQLSVRELCSQVGYENEYSLRRTFQRYEGISITEYREKIKQDKGSDGK